MVKSLSGRQVQVFELVRTHPIVFRGKAMSDWKTYEITINGWKAKALLLAIIGLAFYIGFLIGLVGAQP